VIYYRQPWGRFTVTGRRCRLQILDPVTAFELEPQLVAQFGEPLVMAMAAPEQVFGVLASGEDHDAAAPTQDDNATPHAVAALHRLVAIFRAAVTSARLDGAWLRGLFERSIFDRLRVDDATVEDWASWGATGLGAEARWRVLAAQLQQTYQPLWVRAPYSVRKEKAKDFGVPSPKGVPIAMQWADALVKMGHVSSAHEVVTSWTPVQLMDVVDLAAYQAEIERRAMDAARAQAR
jgi:hypothetical protein